MKARMTRNEVKRHAEHVYRIGYCGASDLLRFLDPVGYMAGVYGWNADVYRIGTTYIVTGYRPGVGEHVDYNLLESYNEKARAICAEYAGYTETVQQLNELREAFINELNGAEV